MPECRYCQRPFGSWWPRNQHETECAERQSPDVLEAAVREQARLEKNEKARGYYRKRIARLRERERLQEWQCRLCGGRATVYSGDGKGHAVSYFCLDCHTIYERPTRLSNTLGSKTTFRGSDIRPRQLPDSPHGPAR